MSIIGDSLSLPIKQYNKVIEELTLLYSLKSIDLFKFSEKNEHIILPDGHHINAEGHSFIYEELKKIIYGSNK